MVVKLPAVDVDPEKIETLEDAKRVIVHLLNVIEDFAGKIHLLMEENVRLRQEISRLKQQPPTPTITAGNRQSPSNYSSEQLLKESKGTWQKHSKKQTIPIDAEVVVSETDQCVCGSMQFLSLRTREKIVQGIIIRRNNTRYHGRDKRCTHCGKIYHAQFPKETHGVQFDATIRTVISYLKHAGRMTEGLILGFLTDFGIAISHGEVSHILEANSDALAPSRTHLRIWGIKKSRYLQTDATGRKRRSCATGEMIPQHLQFVGHALLSIFTITASYNSTTVSFSLTKRGRDKPVVSDDGSPNGKKLLVKKKQLCWHHEIGHYQKLVPHGQGYKELLADILSRLRLFYHLAKAYKRDPTQEKKRELAMLFDAAINQQTGYEKLDQRLCLMGRKPERLLLFLDYPFLPIHNNQSEQSLWEPVIQRKISGETKSTKGDRSIERHLSVIQTARKQGLSIFATLHGLLTGELSPSILTAKTV